MFATATGLLAALMVSLAPATGSDDLAFARDIAAKVEKALPGYKVTVADSLTLTIDRLGTIGTAEQRQAYLDRLAQFCRSNPDECGRETDDFVAKFTAFVTQPPFVPRRADLRAVVRSDDFVRTLQQMLAQAGGVAPVRPLAANLNAVCYFDAPTTMRPATTADLTSLGITTEAAIDVCDQNVRAALPPLPAIMPREKPGERPALTLEHGDYYSSYILLHDDWAALARSGGGSLLVAVPDDGTVLFSRDDAQSLVALSAAVRTASQRGERPISTVVLRWTPAGWDVAAP
jgi:hypothetical protein